MSEKVNLAAYFERIGFSGSIAPTLATLEQLHALHPAAIPFENLDPIIGTAVLLDQSSIEQKLLHNRRGGFCFEQNKLFRHVLTRLEFSVRGYAARVLWGHPEGAQRPISHMVLVVDIAGTLYLADVGFGSFTLTTPLRLRPDIEQHTPNEIFRLRDTGDGFRLEVKHRENWRPVYQFDLIEQSDADYAHLSDVIAADHHARLLLTAARAEPGQRFNLAGARLTVHRRDQDRERRLLTSVTELRTVLSDTFRIALPPAELLDPALAKVLAIQNES